MVAEVSDDVVSLSAAVAAHRDLTREIERRFGGVADAVARSGGYGLRQDIPPDLGQDIRRVPSGLAGDRRAGDRGYRWPSARLATPTVLFSTSRRRGSVVSTSPPVTRKLLLREARIR